MGKPPIRRKPPPPPPYPRPVPEFEVDELPPAPIDLAWNAANGGEYYSDEDDLQYDEIELEKRATKRRRIEACAKAYMWGEHVYIISAQLKGPFANNWKNPWARKKSSNTARMGHGGNVQVEIPETARKITSSVDEEKVAEVRISTPKPSSALRGDIQQRHRLRSPVLEHAPSPFTTKIHDLTGETSPKVPRKAKERRVQEWLHVSDNFANPSKVLVQSSPTPARRRRKTPGSTETKQILPRASQSEPPRIASPRVNSPESSLSLQLHGRNKLSEAGKRIQKLSRDMQIIVEEPIVAPSKGLHDEVERLVCSAPRAPRAPDLPDRAEFAILKAKKRITQTVPADAHMSPFEFKKAIGSIGAPNVDVASSQSGYRTEVQDADAIHSKQQNLKDKQDMDVRNLAQVAEICVVEPTKGDMRLPDKEVFATAPQFKTDDFFAPEQVPTEAPLRVAEPSAAVHNNAPLAATGVPRPALSTFVSEISTTDMPPSAQPQLERYHSVSSLTKDDKMISIKQVASTSENEGQNGGEQINGEYTQPIGKDNIAAETPFSSSRKDRQNHPEPVKAFTPKPLFNLANLNTQEMLANIEPFEMSTVKKVTSTLHGETSNTVTKSKPEKKRKKTSFAFDRVSNSSFGSIKDVMGAKIGKNLASPPSFLLGKDELDVDVSNEENGSPYKRLREMSSMGKPKGILRSINLASTPTSLRKAKSGISIGSREEGQNGLEEDNFDLDAAIDDLGSFLGTWDAEREASSLDIVL